MVTCKVPFLLVLYRTSHVLDPGGGGDVRRGVLRAAVKRQCAAPPPTPRCPTQPRLCTCVYGYVIICFSGGQGDPYSTGVLKTNHLTFRSVFRPHLNTTVMTNPSLLTVLATASVSANLYSSFVVDGRHAPYFDHCVNGRRCEGILGSHGSPERVLANSNLSRAEVSAVRGRPRSAELGRRPV